ELEELAEAISEAIQDLLGVRRAQLILATQGPTSITLEQVGKPGAPACFMMPDSPIHEYFVENRRALLQYVIDYDALYASAPKPSVTTSVTWAWISMRRLSSTIGWRACWQSGRKRPTTPSVPARSSCSKRLPARPAPRWRTPASSPTCGT